MLATIIVSNLCPKNLLLFHIHLLCTQIAPEGSYEILLPDLGNFTQEESSLLEILIQDYPHFSILRKEKANRSMLLNLAASRAKGKWLIFVESHCVMRKTWLHTYISFLEKENAPVVRGQIKDLPNGSWLDLTETTIRNKIETKREQEGKTGWHLDFHNTAILRDFFLSIGALHIDLPVLGEFELGARLHQKGYLICEWKSSLWHKNDTTVSDYMKIVEQNGRDTMRLFLTQEPPFGIHYFPNSITQHLRTIQFFTTPLLLLTKGLNLLGSLGCKILQTLKWRRAFDLFFHLYAKNIHRTGLLHEYKKHRSHKEHR